MALHGSTKRSKGEEGGEEKGSCRRDGTDLDNIWSSLFRQFGGQSTTDWIRNNYHPVFMYLAISPMSVYRFSKTCPIDDAILLIENAKRLPMRRQKFKFLASRSSQKYVIRLSNKTATLHVGIHVCLVR